ncbi:hypothetical protein BO85DRAFT_424038 [Aspergillus piperis CBS 112811]|uniref:Large ribosomal subunit protein mL67 n=1 Tax=Aspergillus piperis CBS 112811 TaxID=1448313 RepID=A0A8G1VJY3_9EURO|nr:hypothetical protein BO85DRAFT_424038 [Aspergillus piperis CBS 112811]RAH56149.1 hypothetical protein BO85DRAFT_424038 [Aspergillus piperis CBS 112811]
MASQQVTKTPFQKILDPTKIGTWNIVRRPPVENHSIIQGKPREQNSNAFKTHQAKEGTRLRKALKALTHGKNIFAYHNIRTNQVVYSLTRYLENNATLKQLLYHGKKTVPARLRKDMWVPYFSVHFNDSKIGLRAYHLLREFSMQRQLSPPKEMITITDAWIDQKRPRDPKGAEDFLEKYKDKIGRIMPKHHRKRAVMDQKATSVADIAAVLKIQEEEVANGFADGKRGYLTPTARKRRRAARAKEEAVANEQAARVAGLEQALSSEVVEYKVQETKDTSGALEDMGVKILWRDLHDARFAENWPERVRHGELELSRDHVMPGQKGLRSEVLAEGEFRERTEQQQQQEVEKN